MAKLIEEIQRDASSDSASVSQLLRRMKIAGSKLKLTQLSEWVGHELDGYPDKEKVPEYRVLVGVPMSFNRFHGWQMMRLGSDEQMNTIFSMIFYSSSVAEVEAVLSSKGPYILSFPEFMERMIIDYQPGLDKVGLSVDKGKFVGILNGVRNRALDWALAVEEAGVTGEGMTFTPVEQQAALNVTNHIYGDNARINQASTDNSSNNITKPFKRHS